MTGWANSVTRQVLARLLEAGPRGLRLAEIVEAMGDTAAKTILNKLYALRATKRALCIGERDAATQRWVAVVPGEPIDAIEPSAADRDPFRGFNKASALMARRLVEVGLGAFENGPRIRQAPLHDGRIA